MKPFIFFISICLFSFLLIPYGYAEQNSLQQLIDNAKPGYTIELEAKIYEGDIVINKPLTIIGKKGTIIQGSKTANVVEIDSDNVTLDTLEVKGSGMSRSSQEEYSGIRVMGNDTTLNNITVKDSFHGILLNRIDRTTLHNLTLIGEQLENLSEQGNGIHILRSNENVIEDSYTEGFRDGIYVEYSDNNEIHNNTMTKTRYGMHYMYSNYNTFENNEFIHNVGGAAIMHSDYITLKNNKFSFNQGTRSFGLLIQTSREVRALNNEFHLNQRGLLIEHATGNFIEGNDFFQNKIGVEVWASAISNTFSENIFTKNTNHVLTVGKNANNSWTDIYGNGNYWDEPMLDLDGNGIGDIPLEYTSSLGDLIEKSDELAYLFLDSPAVKVYEKTNDILGNQDVMALDPYPLLLEKEKNYSLFIATIITTIIISCLYWLFQKKRRKSHEIIK